MVVEAASLIRVDLLFNTSTVPAYGYNAFTTVNVTLRILLYSHVMKQNLFLSRTAKIKEENAKAEIPLDPQGFYCRPKSLFLQ